MTNYQRSPTITRRALPLGVRAEPTRNTNNAAQPSRKSSHPNSQNSADVHTQPLPRPSFWTTRIDPTSKDTRNKHPASNANLKKPVQRLANLLALPGTNRRQAQDRDPIEIHNRVFERVTPLLLLAHTMKFPSVYLNGEEDPS